MHRKIDLCIFHLSLAAKPSMYAVIQLNMNNSHYRFTDYENIFELYDGIKKYAFATSLRDSQYSQRFMKDARMARALAMWKRLTILRI